MLSKGSATLAVGFLALVVIVLVFCSWLLAIPYLYFTRRPILGELRRFSISKGVTDG